MRQGALARAGDKSRIKLPAVTRTTTAALAGVGPAPVPAWRGRLHLVAALVAVPAGAVLVVQAPTGARPAAAIYAMTLIGMFAVSAAYHRLTLSPAGKRRMKRADHTAIFVCIAGNYTLFAALSLAGVWQVVLTAAAWIGAAAGSATKLRRLQVVGGRADFWYQGLGWLGVLALPWLVGRLTASQIALLVGGGLLYTGGAVVLGRKRPDPWPLVFGYHEVGHALMLAGSICHYGVYLSLVQGT